ncbi:MAG: hypothetical protein NVSMB45_04930 [Ginsengibacter sp.]
MNPVFEIIPAYIEPQFTNLFCQISEDTLTYFYQNDKDKAITGLSLYELPHKFSETEFTVKDILDEKQVLRKTYNKVIISYSFSEFALVPYSLYSEEEHRSILNTLYGTGSDKMILNDNLPNLEIHNFYSIPLYIHYYVISHFPLAKFNHEVSYLLKNEPFEATAIQVNFHHSKLVVIVWVNGKLVLANTFFFTAAEDVIYHLLNVCKQLGLDNSTDILVGGMIDNDSALAKEINKYFSKIIYSTHSATLADSLQHFPAHYFSHLFSLV